MPSTRSGNKLRMLKVGGKTLNRRLSEACLSVSLSVSSDQVTELAATFQDNFSQTLLVGERMRAGTTITYGNWVTTAFGVETGANEAGPTFTVRARSRGVSRLEKQTGAKTWGNRDVSTWVKQQARAVGLRTLVQPGLGKASIVREKPEGDNPQSTWDVITDLARQVGAWVFEHSNLLVFARPTWLAKRPGRRTITVWVTRWDAYSDMLSAPPEYKRDGTSRKTEQLTLKLISPDADDVRPGDIVVVKGNTAGPRKGTWIVNDVALAFSRVAPTEVTCQRVFDPEKQPPPPPPAQTKTTGKKTRKGKRSGSRPFAWNTISAAASNTRARGVLAHMKSFSAKYNGRSIDYDGAYGAQCVDLAMMWNEQVVGAPRVLGNGKEWYANCARSGAYVSIPAGGRAQIGDIVTWNGSWGGGYGHVGVVIQDLGHSLRCFDQFNGRTGFHTHSKRGLIGYSRPRKWA